MFKHVEMQKVAHFTIVCIILPIGLGRKNIQENFAKQHVYVYESLQQNLMSLNKTDIPCQEHKINVKFFFSWLLFAALMIG